MSTGTTIRGVSICTHADFNDTEQLLEYFDRVRKINKPRQFSNQTVDIDADEVTNAEIVISRSGSEPSEEGNPNEILIDVRQRAETEPDRLHIHVNADGETLEMANDVYERIVNIVGEIETYILTMDAEVETEFNELSLPIDRDRDYEIRGVNFKDDTRVYLVQNMNTEDLVHFRYTDLDEFYLDKKGASELVRDMKKNLNELVRELEQ